MKNLLRLTACALLWASVSFAQDTASNVLPEETAAQFDSLLMEIAARTDELELLTARAAQSEPFLAELLLERRDALWVDIFQNKIRLATDVAAEIEAGRDVESYREALIPELAELPAELEGMMDRVRERAKFPPQDIEIYQRVMLDQEFFREIANLQDLFETVVDFVDVAPVFEIDPDAQEEFIRSAVMESAANLSAYLGLAQGDVETLTATATTLPDNTEVADRLRAADERELLAAAALQNTVTLLDELELDSRAYRQQLLTATGEITSDVLDVGLVGGLVADWGRTMAEIVRKEGMQVVFRLLFVALILFAFWQLGRLVQRALEAGLNSSHVKMSHLLKKMVLSTTRNIIFGVGILIALSQFGISLGPVLAGLGIAGFIIGFALQDTLSNFASGLMILIYRPFDVGDVVESGGVFGKVSHMSLVNTTFMTLDNQRLIVPNNKIWQDVIKNVTSQRMRRIDLVFGVSYSDDLDKVESVLNQIVEEHESVLDSPEPTIKMHELADSSVNFIVRPWVKTEDYWDVYWDLMKTVKQRFDAEGISIPFPQRDVHMIEPNPA